MTDLALAMAVTRILVAICIAIGGAEYLVIAAEFKERGIFSEQIYILNWARGPRPLVALCRIVFSYRATVLAHAIQLPLAFLLLCPLNFRLFSAILCVLFFIQLHTFYRAPVGHDGSDQMLLVLLPSLSLAYGFGLQGQGAWLALWFIVGQATLSYIASGGKAYLSHLEVGPRNTPRLEYRQLWVE